MTVPCNRGPGRGQHRVLDVLEVTERTLTIAKLLSPHRGANFASQAERFSLVPSLRLIECFMLGNVFIFVVPVSWRRVSPRYFLVLNL